MGLLIAYILGLLTPIKKLPQRAEGGISPTTNSKEENEGGDSLSAFEPQVIPTPTNVKDSCHCCHHKTPLWKIILDWLTFLGVVGTVAAATWYACITQGMWKEMQTQTDLSRKALFASVRNFKLDERAWVIPSLPPGQNAGNNPQGFTLVDFMVVNPGKTQARDVHALVMITTVGERDSLSFDLTEAWPEDIGFLGPNMPQHYGVPLTHLLPNGRRGGVIWSDIREQVNAGRLYVFGYGQVTYRDIFNSRLHTVRFCKFLEGIFVTKSLRRPLLKEQCDNYNRGEEEESEDDPH